MPDVKGALLEVHAVGLQEAVAGIERIEAFASTHGISIPAASRLGRYVAVLRELTVTRTARRGAVDVGGALVEVHQLTAIVDGLQANPSLAAAFRVLLDGHYLTLDAPTHDPARDKQFELYVAARFALGGLPTSLAEPDVVVEFGGEKIGIAVKRPRTAGGIKSAIQKGRRQVRNMGQQPGFLAIDTSMYPLPNARVLATFLDNAADRHRAAAQRLKGLVDENRSVVFPTLMDEPERSGTYGILFHLAVPFMVDGDRGFTAAVGEAWILAPAKLRPFRGLVPLLRCLGTTVYIFGVGRLVFGADRLRGPESP